MNNPHKPRLSSVHTFALIGALGCSSISSAGVTYLENFEHHPIGAIPPGWSLAGDGIFGITPDANHTGIQSPWDTPDFGPEGLQSLGLMLGAGQNNSTILLEASSGGTGQYTSDFAIMYDAGLAGTIEIQMYGDSADSPLIGVYAFDMASGLGTLALFESDGTQVVSPLFNESGVWTEHMTGQLFDSGPRVCDHCSAITYWSRAGGVPQNFSHLVINVRTSQDSAGGSVYIDDVALTDCPVDLVDDGVLDIFDVFAFLDAFGSGDLAVEYTGDGLLDIFDVFAFLDAFNAGCP